MKTFSRGRALVIGVGSYGDPRWDVPTASRDAQSCFEALVNPSLAGYARSDVELLLDAEATREAIARALRRLADRCTPESVALICITSHGAHGDNGLYYLATCDTQFTPAPNERIRAGTGFSGADLVRALRAIPARQVLLVINTCFAGHLSPMLNKVDVSPDPVEGPAGAMLPDDDRRELLATGEGRAIITAGKAGQRSYFAADADHSYFGQALLQALRGGPGAERRGYINLQDLYETIHQHVCATAARARLLQEPVLTLVEGVGPFPVAAYPAAGERAPLMAGDLSVIAPSGAAYTGAPINADVDYRTFLTTSIALVVNVVGPDNPEALRARLEAWAMEWAPHVEMLKRLGPAIAFEWLLHTGAALKSPLSSMPSATDAPSLFRALVDHLAYRLPEQGDHPLLGFVRLVIAGGGLSAADLTAVTAWRDRAVAIYAAHFPGGPAAPAVVQAAAGVAVDPTLLIAFAPDEHPDRAGMLQVRAWLWLGPNHSEQLDHPLIGSYSIEQLEQGLREIYREAREVAGPLTSRLGVEFFLPRDRLATPVHGWSVLSGSEDSNTIQLCSAHLVTVRSYERAFSLKAAFEEARARLQTKWAQLKSQGARIYKLSDPVIPDYLYEELLEPEVCGYAQVQPVPDGVDYVKSVLRQLVDAGLPLGLWLRPVTDLKAEAYQELDALATPARLATLTEEVRRLRLAAGKAIRRGKPPPPLGAALVLLWDNPEHMPPEDLLFASPAAQ